MDLPPLCRRPALTPATTPSCWGPRASTPATTPSCWGPRASTPATTPSCWGPRGLRQQGIGLLQDHPVATALGTDRLTQGSAIRATTTTVVARRSLHPGLLLCRAFGTP